jgi:hypothetical protein
MGYASKCDKAIADANNPIAFSTCDRCGFVYNISKIVWAVDYRGRQLANLRLRVCERCQDVPQNQLRARIIPPDPLPIANARPFPYCEAITDDRVTSNPALLPVDFASTTNIILSGMQFVDGHQLQSGELILVMGQTDTTKNGIYKVSAGVWALQGYDNDTHRYISASEIDTSWSGGVLHYGQLGTYLGAVYVARGSQSAKLFQISYADPSASIAAGTPVTIATVSASTVNRIDFFTGIYMEGQDYVRVTQDGFVRTPQQTGAAPGSLNEIPGWSNLVPGSCAAEVGSPTEAPYGCATRQGLPPEMTSLPFSGALWPTLQNQSINVWLNNFAAPFVWYNNLGVQVTFNSPGFWPNPGPGAPYRPLAFTADFHQWVNQFSLPAFWNNALNQNVLWRNGDIYGILPPGGSVLFTNDKCVLTLWHDLAGDNVPFAEIYPNAIPPNRPGPWPWGWGP